MATLTLRERLLRRYMRKIEKNFELQEQIWEVIEKISGEPTAPTQNPEILKLIARLELRLQKLREQCREFEAILKTLYKEEQEARIENMKAKVLAAGNFEFIPLDYIAMHLPIVSETIAKEYEIPKKEPFKLRFGAN